MFNGPQFLGMVPIAGMGQSGSISVPRQRFLRRSRFFNQFYPDYPYPYPYQYPNQPTELVCRSEKTESGEEIFRCSQQPYTGELVCRKEKTDSGEEVLRCRQEGAAAYPGYGYPGYGYPVVGYPGSFGY